ncbi:MAG: hypothetical protein V7695_15105, partial [Sulfitobacter sp.]
MPIRPRAISKGGTAQQMAHRAMKPAPYFAAMALQGFFASEQPQDGSDDPSDEKVPMQSVIEELSVILISLE